MSALFSLLEGNNKRWNTVPCHSIMTWSLLQPQFVLVLCWERKSCILFYHRRQYFSMYALFEISIDLCLSKLDLKAHLYMIILYLCIALFQNKWICAFFHSFEWIFSMHPFRFLLLILQYLLRNIIINSFFTSHELLLGIIVRK